MIAASHLLLCPRLKPGPSRLTMPYAPPTSAAANAATFGTLAFFLVATLLLGRSTLFKKFDAE